MTDHVRTVGNLKASRAIGVVCIPLLLIVDVIAHDRPTWFGGLLVAICVGGVIWTTMQLQRRR